MRFILLAVFLLNGVFAAAQNDSTPSKISGTITGDKNKPVEGANVVIEGTVDGATTDIKGFFEFETEKTGILNLIVTAMDYSEKVYPIEIQKGKDLTLKIAVSKSVVETEEIFITASSFTSGQNSQVTLTPLEIARIPGADADLYRAITTFPGSNQVDEGSRITVRGGNPEEVLTVLDQASLYNPFIFDGSFNTSSYSTVNPWSLKGINFSSGGFSAKFGNVLSAVLDLKSYDIPQSTGLFAILGLANADLSGSFVSKNGKFGGTFSASQFFIKPFLEINGVDQDYSPTPTTQGLGGTFSYKLSKTEYLKFYLNYSRDDIGVRNASPTYDGYYKTKSNSLFSNAVLSLTPTSTSLLSMSMSVSSFNRDFAYGVIDSRSKDLYSKFRADFGIPLSAVFDFRTGVEYEYYNYKSDGIFPVYSYNIRLNAPSFSYNTEEKTGRAGAYAETQFKPLKNFYVVAGLRSDYHTLSKNVNIDPRFSAVYKLSEHSFLKAATGIYHQYPSLQTYISGNNYSLKPEEAIHYILGYEYNRDGDYIMRVESYYKDYRNLVINDINNFAYSSSGEGFVKGVDVFLKVRFKPKFNGWISYAYTDSKRKQFGAQSLVPADYDITHSISVVSSYNVSDYLTVGASYKISTGKPYTPVTGATYDPTQTAYSPDYAERNSDRFPTYNRLDLNAQYMFSLFGKFAIAFVAFNNVLNQKNLYGYNYNFDYSRKTEIVSSNKRIIYFGIGLQL